jgi:hypothetical protein
LEQGKGLMQNVGNTLWGVKESVVGKTQAAAGDAQNAAHNAAGDAQNAAHQVSADAQRASSK